jgi:hypothetical protein
MYMLLDFGLCADYSCKKNKSSMHVVCSVEDRLKSVLPIMSVIALGLLHFLPLYDLFFYEYKSEILYHIPTTVV